MGRRRERTLCLMRHGKSCWDDETLPDIDRPLNARGQRDVPTIALRLRAAGIRPSLILASNAKRTWETAKLVADTLGYPREFLHREKELYLASASAIASLIADQDTRFHSMLLCGHNPGLTDLTDRLVPDLTDNVPTSAVVCVRAAADDWRTFLSADLSLVRYETPKNAWPA